MSNSTTWIDWDADHVWHPYTQMALTPRAIGVESALGSYLYTHDGQKILDGISSWWVTLHGHAHPKIVSAIAKQAEKLEQVIFAGFTHEPAATLAKRLVEIAPQGLSKVFFSDNGSTAVEAALKMCIQYWKHRGEKRTIFLQLEHAYHGDTFGSMSISAESVFTEPFRDHLFNVKRLPFPTPPENGLGDLSVEESRFLEELSVSCKSEQIAGFIYEPLLLGAGGMLMWRPNVLEEALRIVKEAGIPAIADEVLTGFGRTGTMFASQQTGLAPDIMTLSKGLTGGFLPMGVTMVAQHIYDTFLSPDRTRTFFHGHSYTGNPLSCAAALASLDIFQEEPVRRRMDAIKNVHSQQGKTLATKHSLRFRQLGTVSVLEPYASKGYLGGSSLELAKKALSKGLLIRPLGDVIYLLPPYSSTPEDIEFAYRVLDELLSTQF